MAKYRASIDPRFLTKVDRVFDAAPVTVWNELLQNSRRAGAKNVRVRIQPKSAGSDSFNIHFSDDGQGVDTPEPLLTLAAEGWGGKIEEYEDPAGMGFFCLSNFGYVQVASRDWFANFTPEVFRGEAELESKEASRPLKGLSLSWVWKEKSMNDLATALRTAARWCGIENVQLSMTDELSPSEWEELEIVGFLDNAHHVEALGEVGYSIGIMTKTEEGSPVSDYGAPSISLNFMGVRLNLRDYSEDEMKPIRAIVDCGFDLRIDVTHTAGLRLVLPARNALKHNSARSAMLLDAERVAYAWIAKNKKGEHRLPYSVYKRAKDVFGIDLGEAVKQLRRWSSQWGYGNAENMVLVSGLLDNEYLRVLWHESGEDGKHDMTACRCEPAMKGYEWYDSLPVVTDAEVIVNEQKVDYFDAFDDDQCGPRAEWGPTLSEYIHVAESIKVIFEIKKGEETEKLELAPPVLVRGQPREQDWDELDPDECWFHVVGEVEDDRPLMNEAVSLIQRCFFPSDSADREKLGEFTTRLWRSFLEVFQGKLAGARHELEEHLGSIPYGVRGKDLSWAIYYDGLELKSGARPQIAYFKESLEDETNNRLLEFVGWAEGIFGEYADLKPDEYDDDEAQKETAERIEEQRKYLETFKNDLLIKLAAKEL